jgi:hypothetical protein
MKFIKKKKKENSTNTLLGVDMCKERTHEFNHSNEVDNVKMKTNLEQKHLKGYLKKKKKSKSE